MAVYEFAGSISQCYDWIQMGINGQFELPVGGPSLMNLACLVKLLISACASLARSMMRGDMVHDAWRYGS
jgi:hypothetical protein